jgi:RHS repeat-associated protein
LAQANAGSAGTINYGYRPDGMLTSLGQGGQNFLFGYGDNGLLVSRSNALRRVTIGQRDGLGRILSQTNVVNGANALVELMTWRSDSTLSSYTATRTGTGSWNNTNIYQYNSRGQLTSEPIGITSSVAATNNYTFDANKLGLLVRGQWSGGISNGWNAFTSDSLAQVTSELWNQSGLTLRAGGSAMNASSVSGTLDGSGLGSVSLANGHWFADLSLSTGNHTLAATANYSVGQFSCTAASTFNVVATNSVTNYFDAAGNVTNRIFASGKTQALTWDGFGRLVSIVQRDSSSSGFNWSASYDCFGRRLRTVMTPVATNQLNSAMVLTTDSYYDPEVEFQELAVGLNGQRTWKVLGPDSSEVCGGMQGVGGLEQTVRERDGLTSGIISDFYGNGLATVSGANVNWSPVRVGGYGPALGYQPPVLSPNTPLAETEIWRSRRIDPSGFYYLGARYYDPVAGHFLSSDPLGHSASMDLYSAFNCDPINYFDANGMLAAQNQERIANHQIPLDRNGFVPCFLCHGMNGQGMIPGVPLTFNYVGGQVRDSGGNGKIIGNYSAGFAGGVASFPQNVGNFVINSVSYPVRMWQEDEYVPLSYLATDQLNANATAQWVQRHTYSGVDSSSLITMSGDVGGNIAASYAVGPSARLVSRLFGLGTAPISGETAATISGKAIHRTLAAERRASGEFDLVASPILNSAGEEILVTKRVDLKTGAPLPKTGLQPAIPDAVRYESQLILDDKPVGRLISKDRQEIIRFIRAYQESTGNLPALIAIQRYDPATGLPVVTELYDPAYFMPKKK